MGIMRRVRPCELTQRSHINMCVFDSRWEASEAFELDRNRGLVSAWAKNDHLGFEVTCSFKSVIRKFRPIIWSAFPTAGCWCSK